jgi:hypothetical protein
MALRKYLLTRVRGIAHVHIFLARWSADARAAAYAPGGVGHARAHLLRNEPCRSAAENLNCCD